MVKIAFDEKLCFADQAAGWKKSEFCSGPVHHRLYLYDVGVIQRREQAYRYCSEGKHTGERGRWRGDPTYPS